MHRSTPATFLRALICAALTLGLAPLTAIARDGEDPEQMQNEMGQQPQPGDPEHPSMPGMDDPAERAQNCDECSCAVFNSSKVAVLRLRSSVRRASAE